MTQSVNLDLGLLPSLGELFDAFNAGKHLNRTAEPALWAELESEQKQYQELFGRLGFNLCVDRRGLLSAIWRYLDHFEVLANERADKLEEGIEDDESIETSAEEERA